MSEKGTIFLNPENLPLENVTISVKNEGLVREIKALDPHWAEKQRMKLYTQAPASGVSVIGALDAWIKTMEVCKEDLRSLLRLEYHRFWSTVLFNSSTTDLLVSFLQEAHPPYMPPHEHQSVRETYQEIRRLVLVVYCRLVTPKESKYCHMTKEYMKDILYNKFIFTIPIIWDICLVYGEDNAHTVARMLESVITLQPKYLVDLDSAIAFVKETFKYLILQVNKTYESDEPPNLPETFKGFTDFSKSASTSHSNDKLTLNMLKDLVLHLLDTAMTLRIFLEVYPKGVDIFKRRGLVLSIVQLYEYAIPSLYERLEEFKDNTSSLQDQIDCARTQLLDIFREMLAYYSNLIFSGSAYIESNVEEYLALMMEGLSERLFIRDYHACYPVHDDLEMLRQAYPGLDSVKTDFILQAIYSNIEDTGPDKETRPAPTVQNGHFETTDNLGPSTSIPTADAEIPQNIREESLITEVKDIFPELGDGFVLKCLQHYGFSSERVINCILEDNLDVSLRKLDRNMPIIPEDPMDVKFLETGIDRLNVFDGDQFDIMHRNDVDASKIHKGKKKSKYKDLKDMLNDKTDVRKMVDIYSKYNLVCDLEDYSDEYDDTFDEEGGAPPRGEGTDDLGRPFVTPRVLQKHTVEEESEEEPEPAPAQTTSTDRSRLEFCQNPEEIRARREAQWRLKNNKGQKAPPPRNTDVVGKARGQGQEKEVLHNREKKEKNKSSRANHNRRSGAQWKRSQGMMPS